MDNETIKLLVDTVAHSLSQLAVQNSEVKNTVERIEKALETHDAQVDELRKELQQTLISLKDAPDSTMELVKQLTELKMVLEGTKDNPGLSSKVVDIWNHVSNVKKITEIIKNPLSIALAILIVIASIMAVLNLGKDGNKITPKVNMNTVEQQK